MAKKEKPKFDKKIAIIVIAFAISGYQIYSLFFKSATVTLDPVQQQEISDRLLEAFQIDPNMSAEAYTKMHESISRMVNAADPTGPSLDSLKKILKKLEANRPKSLGGPIIASTAGAPAPVKGVPDKKDEVMGADEKPKPEENASAEKAGSGEKEQPKDAESGGDTANTTSEGDATPDDLPTEPEEAGSSEETAEDTGPKDVSYTFNKDIKEHSWQINNLDEFSDKDFTVEAILNSSSENSRTQQALFSLKDSLKAYDSKPLSLAVKMTEVNEKDSDGLISIPVVIQMEMSPGKYNYYRRTIKIGNVTSLSVMSPDQSKDFESTKTLFTFSDDKNAASISVLIKKV